MTIVAHYCDQGSHFLIAILTERTKAILDDPNLEGSVDARLDSASIAKVKFFLHAYLRFDPIDLVSLTLAWSDKTAQHGPGKSTVGFYYVSMNGCSLTIELSAPCA